jgi:hypothetical protein
MCKEQEAFESGSVGILLTADKLIVAYDYDEEGKDRTVAMDVPKEDWDLVNNLLSDVNFWTNFLSSFSAAITQHKG